MDFAIADKPFDLGFASIVPKGPSIGAFQFKDPEEATFFSRQWPKCIHGSGKIGFHDDHPIIKEIALRKYDSVAVICRDLRKSLWMVISQFEKQVILDDQKSRGTGYRRSYVTQQRFDITDSRRPNNSEYFHPATTGEFLGPGLVSVKFGVAGFDAYEYVWSEIFPFHNPTDRNTDLDRIREIVQRKRLHINSIVESEDARRHIEDGDVRGAIRSGAAAVEAHLRYFCTLWDVKFPTDRNLQFDDKIETILQNANMPSYGRVDPNGLEKLLYLYRASNARHEGDRYYKDNTGKRVHLRNSSDVEPLIDAAEQFCDWLEWRV